MKSGLPLVMDVLKLLLRKFDILMNTCMGLCFTTCNKMCIIGAIFKMFFLGRCTTLQINNSHS